MVGADIFMINNENLYIIDYFSKFPVVKRVESLSAKDLMQAAKVVFAEFGLAKKLVSDAGTNFVSEHFKEFCRHMNTDLVVTSLYHHQSKSMMEAFIKFVKCSIKKCRQTNNDVHFALLQIRSTLVNAGLPSPAMMLFNIPIRALLPQIGRASKC